MWLLESSIKRAIENAESQGFTPSADQVAQFNASLPAGAVDTSRVMAVAGGKAQIDVRAFCCTSVFSRRRILLCQHSHYHWKRC